MADPTAGSSMTLEESEATTSQDTKPDLTKVVLDGDEVPEHLRGKSMADAIKMLNDSTDLLKKSESERLSQQAILKNLAERPAATPVPAVPVPEAPKELTREELLELHEKDPLAAIEVMQAQAFRQAERNLETRLGPMMAGSAASAESTARQKYADEFALFGEEITRVAAGIPDARTNLANPKAWDDIVAYVRGRPGNFDKLVERKTQPKREEIQREAQLNQQDAVGFSESSPTRKPIPRNSAQLDPLQREIADKMGISYDDYVKWSAIS